MMLSVEVGIHRSTDRQPHLDADADGEVFAVAVALLLISSAILTAPNLLIPRKTADSNPRKSPAIFKRAEEKTVRGIF